MTSPDQTSTTPSWKNRWAPAPQSGDDVEIAPAEIDSDLADPIDFPTAEPAPQTSDFHVQPRQRARALRPVPPVAAPPAPAAVVMPFSEPGGEPKMPPTAGVRRMIFDTVGLNLGRSKADVRRDALVARMNVSPGKDGYRIAVLTIKGGVGKTTSTAGILTSLGMNAASTRVLGIDANPATGTLRERLDAPSEKDIRHLMADPNLFTVDENTMEIRAAERTATYPGFTSYTGKSKANYEVVQGSENIAAAHQFTATEYNALLDVAEQFFPIIVTDCGTELHHDVTRAVLARADMVVIVAGTAKGTVKKAQQTLGFLHNYPSNDLDENIPLTDEYGDDIAEFRHLLSRCVIVINDTGQRGRFKTAQLKNDFMQVIATYHAQTEEYRREQLTAQVLELPYDAHLAADGPIVYDLLAKNTKWAILELAAAIGDDFHRAAERRRRSAASGARR